MVDDDSTTTFLQYQLLNRLQVAEEVLIAHHGQEALQTLAQLGSEASEAAGLMLGLLDVNLPVLNGVDFLAAYQQRIGRVVVVHEQDAGELFYKEARR